MNNNKQIQVHQQQHYDVSLLTPSPPSTTTTKQYTTNLNSNGGDDCVIVGLMNDDIGNDKKAGIDIDKFARDMFDRIVAKGNEKLSEIVRKRGGERSDNDNKKKRALRKTVKLLNNQRKSGDQVSTIFSITNNGKHLIPGAPDQMQSPECLESVMELYSDDDQN